MTMSNIQLGNMRPGLPGLDRAAPCSAAAPRSRVARGWVDASAGWSAGACGLLMMGATPAAMRPIWSMLSKRCTRGSSRPGEGLS